LNAAIAPGASRFVRELLPGWTDYAASVGLALHGVGAERRAACGIHGGERGSLAVNVETGAWLCHACGALGGDTLDYHRALSGAGFADAARGLGAWSDAPARAAAPPRSPAEPAHEVASHETLAVYGRVSSGSAAGPRHPLLLARKTLSG
jgi:hypothetical protein